jgi:hypothetical protein
MPVSRIMEARFDDLGVKYPIYAANRGRAAILASRRSIALVLMGGFTRPHEMLLSGSDH